MKHKEAWEELILPLLFTTPNLEPETWSMIQFLYLLNGNRTIKPAAWRAAWRVRADHMWYSQCLWHGLLAGKCCHSRTLHEPPLCRQRVHISACFNLTYNSCVTLRFLYISSRGIMMYLGATCISAEHWRELIWKCLKGSKNYSVFIN